VAVVRNADSSTLPARAWPARLVAFALLVCAALPMLPRGAAPASVLPDQSNPAAAARELPREWDGKRLRPLALSAVEQRFSAQFPGRVARLTDGESVLVWRDVNRPTRMLHPAADCYRALGYRIEHAGLEHDARSRLWRCSVAVRGGQRLRVCERIEDAAGGSFTDASSWYWAALLGRSTGPWSAITVTREL
jgi:hypothetical protein